MCQQYCVPSKHRMDVCINSFFSVWGLKSGMFSMVYPNGPLTLSAISLKAVEMSCKEDMLPLYAEINLPNLPP